MDPVLTRRRLDWSDIPADDIEPVAIKTESLSDGLSENFRNAKIRDIFRKESFRNGEPFQNAKKLRTPALKDTLRFAPKAMERHRFESLLSGVKHYTVVDQLASEVAEKVRFQLREKEAHDNLITQEEARTTTRQPAARQLSAMRRFDTEQGAIAEQRAVARSKLSMAMPAVGTEMHSRRRMIANGCCAFLRNGKMFAKTQNLSFGDRMFAKQSAKDKWLLQEKLNAEQSMNQMDTPWFHPGDGTARSIKMGESKDVLKWNAMESKNGVVSKWNALVSSEAHVEKGYRTHPPYRDDDLQ
jgi:hypothetical protein